MTLPDLWIVHLSLRDLCEGDEIKTSSGIYLVCRIMNGAGGSLMIRERRTESRGTMGERDRAEGGAGILRRQKKKPREGEEVWGITWVVAAIHRVL